jgi:hypothetical protein
MELLQITTNVAQGMMAMPFIKWREILSVVGDALNMPNLAEMIDQSAMQKMMQPQAPAPAQPQTAPNQRTNAMGEPSPIPPAAMAGLSAAANRA